MRAASHKHAPAEVPPTAPGPTHGRPSLAARIVRPFLSPRFTRFAAVGASGVVVNLGVLAILRRAGLHTNVASALAIELSIVSNFVINRAWTFRDRRQGAISPAREAMRFHLVSLGGASIQFLIFVAANLLWLAVAGGSREVAAYQAGMTSTWQRWIWRPLVAPPDVGAYVYLSQVAGIACATAWNYLLNFYWTWGDQRRERADDLRRGP